MTTLIPKYSQVTTANRTIAEKFSEQISVKDFGAIGDGVADDTAAINAAINYFQLNQPKKGGQIYFPRGQYRVTSTIEVYNPSGLIFIGCMGSESSNPTIVDGADSSFIFGDGIPNTKPVFYFWAGHNVQFKNLIIFGARGSDSPVKAAAAVWIDFNHQAYRFYNCKFCIASFGIRVCSSYNHSTGAWTPGVSAYDGTTYPPSVLAGGFASDNGVYEDCEFDGNSIADLSIESAQALDMVSRKCIFIALTGAKKAVHITGCQGMSFYDATIIGETFLYLLPQTSVANIVTYNSHIENSLSPSYILEHGNFTSIGVGVSVNQAGGGSIRLKGALTTPRSCVTINNSNLDGIELVHEGMNLIVSNTNMGTFSKSTGATSQYMSLTNVNVSTSISTNWSNTFDSLIVEHCNIIGYPALSNVPLKVSGRSQYDVKMILGGIADTGSATAGMEGLVFHAGDNNATLTWGCYYNTSSVLIASATSGGQLVFINTGLQLSKFTGATIGTTPTLVAGAYA